MLQEDHSKRRLKMAGACAGGKGRVFGRCPSTCFGTEPQLKTLIRFIRSHAVPQKAEAPVYRDILPGPQTLSPTSHTNPRVFSP